MINFLPSEAKKEFEAAFGVNVDSLTANQLMWLVKFAKHVRGRCRSNAAFNNYANALFGPTARFVEVPKMYQGRSYRGLEIRKTHIGDVKETVASDNGDDES